tara:strand:- start:353 stop:505 length:153 start_codon:yes stop_codon:yes gene_type:complete
MANRQNLIFAIRDTIDEVIDSEDRGSISSARADELLDELNSIETFLQFDK